MKPPFAGKNLTPHFAVAAALLAAGCDGGGEKTAWWSGERERIELSQRLELNRFQYENGASRDFGELRKLLASNETAATAIAGLRARRTELTGEVLGMEEGYEDFRHSVLAVRRQHAPAETPAELTLPRGRTLHGVTVTDIDDAGVTLRHEHGSVRLSCADLDDGQRAFFGLDQDFARPAVERENQAAADYARSVAASLAEEQVKQERIAARDRREELVRQRDRLALARIAAVVASARPLAQPATHFGSRSTYYNTFHDPGYWNRRRSRVYYYNTGGYCPPSSTRGGYLPGVSPYRGYSPAPSNLPWMQNCTKPADSITVISP